MRWNTEKKDFKTGIKVMKGMKNNRGDVETTLYGVSPVIRQS